jgi:hypothetical protein
LVARVIDIAQRDSPRSSQPFRIVEHAIGVATDTPEAGHYFITLSTAR